MKNLIFVFVLFIASHLKSQNNELDINGKWDIMSSTGTGQCIEHHDFNRYFNGDTIINGNQYFKVDESFHNYSTFKYPNVPCAPNDFYGVKRMTNLVRYYQKKLFIWSTTLNKETIFLDYNIAVGDTIKNVAYVTPYEKPVITDIDSILINGDYYLKRLYYKTLNGTGNNYIIEKIGSSNGFLLSIYGDVPGCSNLLNYSENNITLYNVSTINSGCYFIEVSVNEKAKQPSNISIFH